MEGVFGGGVDDGMTVKIDGDPKGAKQERCYSPGACKDIIEGEPFKKDRSLPLLNAPTYSLETRPSEDLQEAGTFNMLRRRAMFFVAEGACWD